MSAITTHELVEVDERRLLRRLDDLAQRGALPSGGIYRPLYSPAWTSAMDLVASWMKEAGLLVKRDAVGNVWGRIEGSRGGRVIATGSHIDTVRGGGALDGALGVVAGIEAVSSLWQRFGRSTRILECVAICEEEGSRFDTNFWGARAIADRLEPGETDRARDSDCVTLGDAIDAEGKEQKKLGAQRGLGEVDEKSKQFGATGFKPAGGFGGFGAEKPAEVDISGNTIRNTTQKGIHVRQIGGRARIERNIVTMNVVYAGPAPSYVNGILCACSGSYLITHNLISVADPNGAGIRIKGCSLGGATERANITDNDVFMAAAEGAVPGVASAGIEIKGLARGTVVQRNRIRGRARIGLSVVADKAGSPTGNTFDRNDEEPRPPEK